MRRLLLLLSITVTACAQRLTMPAPVVNTPRPVPAPVIDVVPTPEPVRSYDGHVRYMAGWLPNSGPDGSAPFTNAQMLTMDCGQPEATDKALRAKVDADSRAVILHSGLMGWGNEGYQVVEEPARAQCWSIERRFISDYRSRIIEVHTSDEPPDVAWSHWVDGGARYDPNRYNGDLSIICSTVHADFPDLPCAVNYGSVPDGLQVASGLNHVWLETYDPDWHTKLNKLSALTTLPLALMPPGFAMGDPAILDSREAGIVLAEWGEAKANPRINQLVFFLWCCDDLTTGDKNFHTVSGGDMPLTLAALQAVGQQIRGGR